MRDQLSNIRGERRRGREEGRKEGMAILIQNMVERGMEVSEIAKLTGLTEEEVQGMVKEKK